MAQARYQNPRYNYGTAAPSLQPRPVRPGQYEVLEKTAKKPARDLSGLIRAIFFVLVSVALIASCIFLLSVRSEITSTNSKVTVLQDQLQTLKTDNDAKEVYLNKSINLTDIYNKATGELGMTYPSDENVIFYHRSDAGYVRQYEDIPTN